MHGDRRAVPHWREPSGDRASVRARSREHLACVGASRAEGPALSVTSAYDIVHFAPRRRATFSAVVATAENGCYAPPRALRGNAPGGNQNATCRPLSFPCVRTAERTRDWTAIACISRRQGVTFKRSIGCLPINPTLTPYAKRIPWDGSLALLCGYRFGNVAAL